MVSGPPSPPALLMATTWTVVVPSTTLHRGMMAFKIMFASGCCLAGATWSVRQATSDWRVEEYGVLGGLGGGLYGILLVTQPVSTLAVSTIGGCVWNIIREEKRRRGGGV